MEMKDVVVVLIGWSVQQVPFMVTTRDADAAGRLMGILPSRQDCFGLTSVKFSHPDQCLCTFDAAITGQHLAFPFVVTW